MFIFNSVYFLDVGIAHNFAEFRVEEFDKFHGGLEVEGRGREEIDREER
jgi:hypothetical protein